MRAAKHPTRGDWLAAALAIVVAAIALAAVSGDGDQDESLAALAASETAAFEAGRRAGNHEAARHIAAAYAQGARDARMGGACAAVEHIARSRP